MRRDRSALFVIALSFAGCTAPETPGARRTTPDERTPPSSPAAPSRTTASFGGERYGFVEATSSNGRFVALRRFEGNAPPQFGHHGEAFGSVELHLVDLVDGTERAIDDVIDVEPTRRWFLLVDHGTPVLFDSDSNRTEALADIDPRSDENACLPPRGASFSASGTRVAWIVGDGSSARIRDLTTGDEWTARSTSRIWRAFPDDAGRGAVLAEVAAGGAEWPNQNTSCSCRWCTRFAASFGFYGWSGPAFELVHVSDDGSREPRDPEDGEREWTGVDREGCTIRPREEERGLERGPWRRECD